MTERYIKLTELPEALRAACAMTNYRKADILVKAAETFFPHSGGGGSRGVHVAVNLATGAASEPVYGSWGGSNAFVTTIDDLGQRIAIPKDTAVLSGTEGNRVFLTLYVHPDNVAALLTDETAKPRDEILAVLAIVKGYKSFARPDYFARYGLGRFDVANPLVAECIGKGWLKANKVGSISITTEGKNQLGGGITRIPESIEKRNRGW